MAFNSNKFIKQEFKPRTAEIQVPGLKDFFDKDDEVVWVVRNLEANEITLANESVAKNKNIAAITEALVDSNQIEKVKAIRDLIGNPDDVTGDMAKRLEMIVFASVSPEITMDIALKLAKNFPIEFMTITHKITLLTHTGADMVKPEPSGETGPSVTV